MKISLVIPAHNEELYIESCLDHAIRHGAEGLYEIIVVDNASTDATSDRAKRYPGVRVVHEEKKGLTHARQRGFSEAQGTLLAYIDADTRMPAGWVDTVAKEFADNPKLAVLSGPYVYYDIPAWQRLLVRMYYLGAMPLYFLTGYMATGGNFVIRRDILEKMNGFDTSIAFYGEDTDLARRAHAFGKVKFKPSFIMHTSGRRLSGQGIAKTALIYSSNYLSEAVLRHPATKKYKDIR